MSTKTVAELEAALAQRGLHDWHPRRVLEEREGYLARLAVLGLVREEASFVERELARGVLDLLYDRYWQQPDETGDQGE